MIIDFHNLNGGGGGGTADYATSAGTSNSSKLLNGEANFPQSANTGDVVAIGEQSLRGTKSGTKRPLPPAQGIYQYDGVYWNKIETETPDFTSLMPVSSFPENPVAGEVVAIVEQPEVVKSVNPTRGGAKSPVQPEEVSIYQYDGVNWNKVGGEGSSAYKIELMTPYPEDFTEGDVDNLNAFYAALAADPSIGDGAYIKCGDEIFNILEYSIFEGFGEFSFGAANTGDIRKIFFHFENSEYTEGFYYENDFNYLNPSDSVPEEPVEGTIANYDDGEGNIGLWRFDGEDWQPFGGGDNTILKPVSELPESGEIGEVVALGNYSEREPTSADVFTSATVTMVDGRATFKMYNPNYGGYCDDYTFGYDENEGIISSWTSEGNVIGGPWNDHGVEFSISGNDITFTTQNPEDTEVALRMWGFDPNCNERFITNEVGVYQYDGSDWNEIGGEGGSGDAVYKIATTEDAVSGEVGTTFVDRLPVEKEEAFVGGEVERGHNLSLKRVINVDYGEVGTGEGGFSFSYYILPENEGTFTVDDSINCELSIDNTGDGYDLVVALHKIVGEEEVESDELVRETFDFDSFEYSDDILLPSWCLNFGEGYPQMSDIYLHVFVNSSSNFGEYEVSLNYIPDGEFNFDNDLKRFSFSSGETNTGIFENLESYKTYIDYKAPAEWNRKLQIVSNKRSDVVTFNLKPNEHVHYRILDGKDLWGTAYDPYASVEDEVPQLGDMCFDTTDGCLYVWCNDDWQEIYNSGGIM